MNHPYRPAPRFRPTCPRRRHSTTVVAAMLALTFAVGVTGFVPGAMAQRALPQDLKSAADVKSRVGEINTFVAAQVANLKNDKDPKAQQDARNALAREASTTASPSF